jgi:S1-C subfamily serine protease
MPRISSAGRGLVAALITLLLIATHPGSAAADESQSPSPEVSRSTILAANAYPGVQLISTTYSATVTVSIPVINQAALADLAQRVATQAITGAIDTTEEALTEAIVDAVVKSPNTYFIAGPRTYSRRNRLVGVGTGWVITPDGYIVTAAHVVETPNTQLRQEFAVNSLSKLGQQFVRGLENSGTTFTRDQVDRLTDAILGWLAAHLRVDALNVAVAANLALGFDGLGKQQKAVAAEIVDVGKPYPGNDVALLKIDGQEHLPTIAVGADDDVSPGSTVHVVGFPAASTFSPGLSRDAQVQPTVTEGPVTAIKSTGSGMPVFQTQAPSSPGNSGGPVLTDDGTSVGVLVATAVNSDGSAAQGQAFVIPASEVLDMLEQNGVTARESDTTAAYADGVDAFYAERYKEAVPLFEKSQTLYPAHPFAAKFIQDSKTAIEEGRDKTPANETSSPDRTWLWLALGGLALLLLGVGGTALFFRSRMPKQPLPGPTWGPGQPVPPGVPSGYAPYAPGGPVYGQPQAWAAPEPPADEPTATPPDAYEHAVEWPEAADRPEGVTPTPESPQP